MGYLSAVDAQLLSASRNGARALEEFVRSARGASPSLVRDRLAELGLSVPTQGVARALSEQPCPELHPLDYEWYFSRICAQSVAEKLSQLPSPILCLGAPTVAKALAEIGHSVVLIDRNPLVEVRLGRLHDRIQLQTTDLTHLIRASHQFGTVFFDAPWYPEQEELWLWQATRAVRPGGTIAFSLPPPLLRPMALTDRVAILHEAERIGDVSIEEEVLTYDTPLFEAEALRASGLPLLPNWRTSDLVLITNVRGLAERHARDRFDRDIWDTWVIGCQVIKLRRTPGSNSTPPLQSIPGTVDWVYHSVSRRDPSRASIDLWTSRNRVAKVGQWTLVVEALDALSREEDGRSWLPVAVGGSDLESLSAILDLQR
jgi:hypothetical protein